MLDNTRIELAKHRLDTAKEDYLAALDLIKNGRFKVAKNRDPIRGFFY